MTAERKEVDPYASVMFEHREEVAADEMGGKLPFAPSPQTQDLVFTPKLSSGTATVVTDGTLYKRLNDVQNVAARDRAGLMKRIEDLCATIRTLREEVRERDDAVQQFQRLLGPVDEFSTRQVQLREEIVLLRDNVRHWQEREAAAREECGRLRRTIDGLKRTSDFDSAESRLVDLQERLARAHLQAHEAEQELRELQDLSQQQQVHSDVTQRSALAEQQAWRARGREAELTLVVQQKQALVESLSQAVKQLEAVATTPSGQEIGASNRKCPGCGKPQWLSPYCPQTGHGHLGFGIDLVAAALDSGEWRKLVQVGTFEVSYQHVATGRVVQDLRAELVNSLSTSRVAVVASSSPASAQQGGEEKPAAVPPLSLTPNVKPNYTKEVERLLHELKRKQEENNKLRGLLKSIVKRGMIAMPIANPVIPNATDQAQNSQPQAGSSSSCALEVASEAKNVKTDDELVVLRRRVIELIIQVAQRDEQIRSLQAVVESRLGRDGVSGPATPFAALAEAADKRSIAVLTEQLRDAQEECKKEHLRCCALEDLLRNLNSQRKT